MKLKKFLSGHFLPVLIILLLGVLPLTWFRGNLLIDHGDQAFPVSPIKDFENYVLYYWNHLLATGFPVSASIAAFSSYLLPLLSYFGLSLPTTEKLIYYFIFTGAGLSIYYLVISINPKEKQLAGFGAALAYLFNFYSLFTFWSSLVNMAYFYVSLPLLLAIYIKLLNFGKRKYFIFWLIVATLLFSSAAINPGYLLVLTLTHFLYFLYYVFIINRGRNCFRELKTSLLLSFSWLLLNAWWWIPSFTNIGEALVTSGAKTLSGSEGILRDWSAETSFVNLFRFFGPWTFDSNLSGDPYYPWHAVYNSLFFLAVGFLGPCLAFISLFRKKVNKFLCFFGLLFLLGIFMMKGIHSPFGFINHFLVIKIPFLVVFRNSYEKFGVMTLLGFAVLFGMGLVNFKQLLIKRFKKAYLAYGAIFVIAVLYFGFYFWPYWKGDVIYGGGKIKPSARVKIPDYYYEAGNWLKEKEGEFRILSLPHQQGAAYRWEEGYVGSDDPAIRLLRRPIVSPFNPGDPILEEHLRSIFDTAKIFPVKTLLTLSGLTNIRYVMLHHDLVYEINTPDPTITADMFKLNFENNSDLKLTKSFGKLDFYEIAGQYFFPQFYVPDQFVFSAGNSIDVVADLYPIGMSRNKPGYILADQSDLINQYKEIGLKRETDEVIVKASNKNLWGSLSILDSDNTDSGNICAGLGADTRENSLDFVSTFSKKLCILNKYIFDLQRLSVSVNPSTLRVNEIWQRYLSGIQEAFVSLEGYTKTNSDVAEGVASLEVTLRFHKNLFLSLCGNDDCSGNVRSKFSEFESYLSKLKQPGQEIDYRYSLSLPESGKYQLVAKLDSGLIENPQILLEGNSSSGSAMINDASWNKIWEGTLTKNSYSLTLRGRNSEDLLGGEWKTSSENQGYYYQQITSYKSGHIYKITISNNLSDYVSSLAITEDDNFRDVRNNTIPSVEISLVKNGKGDFSEYYFRSGARAKRGQVYLLVKSSVPVKNSLFANISLRDVTEPSVQALNIEPQNINPRVIPNISFSKINPTFYKVYIAKATEPFFLVFSESFNSGWQLSYSSKYDDDTFCQSILAKYLGNSVVECGASEKFISGDTIRAWRGKQISEDHHFAVNGYANGWYVDPKDTGGKENFELTVEFTPQRIVYFGLAISFFSLIGFVVIYSTVQEYLRHRREMN